jgi:predicted unusual protein kinase regulating ubiquinone biosynthesis (AarF/ABC1/UbiB family)
VLSYIERGSKPNSSYLKQVAKDELARECDYKLEASNQKRFRELLKDEKALYVPRVYDEFSNTRVLATELVPGNLHRALMPVYFSY